MSQCLELYVSLHGTEIRNIQLALYSSKANVPRMQPKRFSGCSRADAISSLRRLRDPYSSLASWHETGRRDEGAR